MKLKKAKMLLTLGVPVIASIAPSFVANYDGISITAFRNALKKLGFYDVEETAWVLPLLKMNITKY